MRSYWIKILLSAAVVFAIGMIVMSAFRSVKHTVDYVADSTGPISTPLAFLPFNLGRRRVGTFRGLKMYRDSLGKPASIVLTVSLRDSVTPDEVRGCLLAMLPNSGNSYSLTDYSCLTAADTAGRALADIGFLKLRGTEDSFPLLAPAKDVQELRQGWGGKMSAGDSAQQVLDDSVRASIQARIDTMRAQTRVAVDSLQSLMPGQ
jgi:hypothetical protein